jgi:eukaryotic-like serine/threonine-protein kinase
MDFSLLADRRAPWHGHQGYVGTDNYRSPEHLMRGAVPGFASDVFTCGLMLYELLAGEHPYWRDDPSEYAKLVMAYSAKPPALLGLMQAPASNAEVSAAIYRCLSPDPSARPTAAELRSILSGRGAAAELSKASSVAPTPSVRAATTAKAVPATTAPAKTAVSRAAAAPVVSDGVELTGPDGRSVRIGIRTELGKALVRQFGPDGEFWDDRQCVLERNLARQWFVSPVAGTTNETLINGETLTAPTLLRHGDRIAVGRQAKGVIKMPLTVRAR